MKIQLFVVFSVLLFAELPCQTFVNKRPIIGIMTEEWSDVSAPVEKSFLMSYYVKFIEASGAQVVPIQIYKPKQYYQDILKKVNGVLLPGGGDILNSDGYGRTAKLIFDIALQMNKKGDYFPVWGTCLGFELLNYAVAKKMWMKSCSAEDWITNIELIDGYNNSRLFRKLPTDLKNKMKNENLALHLHHWCITPENYTSSGLDKFFRILALNKDSQNETFVSIIEAIDYPFYGVTFHPEKVVFDWSPRNISTPHTVEAIQVSQYFGNFFVSEARKNLHRFPSKKEELSSLIYNYDPHIVGAEPSAKVYVFQ